VKDLECTTDRWADPLPTDDPIMAKLRPLLAGEGERGWGGGLRGSAALAQQQQLLLVHPVMRKEGALCAILADGLQSAITLAWPVFKAVVLLPCGFLVLLVCTPPGTQLETETLRCAYSATEDGWSAAAFHEGVDGYGATLVVARTQVQEGGHTGQALFYGNAVALLHH
jgi:hypothetical protein